ncbi:U-box domain-containing protein 9-like [Juglans microcarpa x Juglans regia]|uniref:U-box domain-containing protein 9-like n=1 Tax=Juglans microcarpa x Juglans regia TaxID=2249226 RepID=UPI001B7EB87D|nr:U-box domain-containing protein 9-like [Juglans microcarpa x Juglans regia]
MPKSVVSETDGVVSAKATVLKNELRTLVNTILDEDDYKVETTDEAIRTLRSLRDLNFDKSLCLKLEDHSAVPEEFRCPISRKLIRDPVVLATGETYDRIFIQRWLNEGHRICPKTQEVLPHIVLTSNKLVREMISHWCREHGVELPKAVQDIDDELVTAADRGYLSLLLKKLSQPLNEQKEAAKELRHLTKKMPSFRALFGEFTDAIPQLLNPLSAGRVDTHPDLQEDLITTVLNVSIWENNKRLVAENPVVIPLLIESLIYGTIQTKSNAAAALFTLSALDSNKLTIGESCALGPLIDLLDEGHPLAMKDVASAIFNLCIVRENKRRAVHGGAVKVILKKIMDCILVDELLTILAMLSGHRKAVEEMSELGAVPFLLSFIREDICERSKENSAAILYAICIIDRTKLVEIREEENANGTLSRLAQSGTSWAKRKANGILERLNRTAPITHTA